MQRMNYAAPCLFGLEGLLADELRAMGAENVKAENGRVLFEGDDSILARANIGCRFAERILILIGSFPAKSFEELFEGTRNLPLERYIRKHDAFPVKGWSIGSALHSIPDCQSIIKKAAVKRLESVYGISWFEETGPVHSIQFSILKDQVSIMLDTSGEGLHKRGYRKNANAAPLKETLAAAMAYAARIFPDSQVYDPFCGSGTLLIESALQAFNIAPGINRHFAAERFDSLDGTVWRQERERAKDLIKYNKDFMARGFDIDAEAVQLTLHNAKLAGVAENITAETREISAFSRETERGLVLTNPPYGQPFKTPLTILL